MLGRGHEEKGLDDAFKKVTAPVGVDVVRNRIGISPSPLHQPHCPQEQASRNQWSDTPPTRDYHLSPAMETMTTSSIIKASPGLLHILLPRPRVDGRMQRPSDSAILLPPTITALPIHTLQQTPTRPASTAALLPFPTGGCNTRNGAIHLPYDACPSSSVPADDGAASTRPTTNIPATLPP